MKSKKILTLLMLGLMSMTLMGCPSIQNSVPEFVLNEDGVLSDINHIYYDYEKGTAFSPDIMLTDLITEYGLMAIDYDQSKVIWGQTREYYNISDQIVINSFYAVWSDGEDANDDGVVDELDEEYYGTVKLDDEGNKIYDPDKILLVQILPVGQEINFTLGITDEDGAFTELSGTIRIVSAT